MGDPAGLANRHRRPPPPPPPASVEGRTQDDSVAEGGEGRTVEGSGGTLLCPLLVMGAQGFTIPDTPGKCGANHSVEVSDPPGDGGGVRTVSVWHSVAEDAAWAGIFCFKNGHSCHYASVECCAAIAALYNPIPTTLRGKALSPISIMAYCNSLSQITAGNGRLLMQAGRYPIE